MYDYLSLIAMTTATCSYNSLRFLSKPVLEDPKALKLLGIERHDDVRILDETEDGLTLVHYVSESPDQKIAHIRGIVYDQDYNIVCKSFPYTLEVTYHEYIKATKCKFPTNASFVEAEEGTILRLFNYGGVWRLSTHHKINGRRSRWAGPTFGDMFNDCWGDNDFSDLDETMCYVFLLVHPENKLVCCPKVPYLLHVLTLSRIDGMTTPVNTLIQRQNVRTPVVRVISSWVDMMNIVDDLNALSKTGLMVFEFERSDGMPTVTKIINEAYLEFRNIRGNEPNLRIRYFELMADGQHHSLRSLLPEKTAYFDKCDAEFKSVVCKLRNCYIARYVNGYYVVLPSDKHRILVNIRRQNRVVALEESIATELLKSGALSINRAIKGLYEKYNEQ